jgi:hypothetical protein
MTIGILVGLIAVAVALVLFGKKYSSDVTNHPPDISSTVYQTVPDSAVGFGYKCMWFAVKTDNTSRLAELLELKNVSDCNWRAGVDKAYNGSVFITPSIDGWTSACGWGLPHGDSKEGIEEVKRVLRILSTELGEAQYFCTHRVSEYHCWMKAINGQIERAYSYSGESGENGVIEGEPTEFERTLKLANTFSVEANDPGYFEREDIIWANESLVMQIAANWSIDPSILDQRKDIPLGLGLLGQR